MFLQNDIVSIGSIVAHHFRGYGICYGTVTALPEEDEEGRWYTVRIDRQVVGGFSLLLDEAESHKFSAKQVDKMMGMARTTPAPCFQAAT